MSTTTAGLEGVIAGESSICYIDGHQGILSYCGYNIHTLARNATFEEVIFLLWNGRLPNRSELDQLKSELATNRTIPQQVIDYLASVPDKRPMDVLRTAVSLLGVYDPTANDPSLEAKAAQAGRLMAQTSTIVTTYHRLRTRQPIPASDPSLSFSANFLYSLSGKRPDDVMERAFDVAMILHADHELNASTFAARVTAATLSDLYSAMTSAIGALKGPLHGGANEDVIRMLLAVGSAETAVEQVRESLSKKVKIPGFGHRVYRTEDPRATHLRVLSEELGRRTGHYDFYVISSRVEEFLRGQKGLNPNVDFYSASTYYCLDIPIDLFTPVFAVSRMSGWTAHALEQYRNNRLIRPRADYIGEPDGRPWVAMASR
ncbi:MAG: citrate synthase [Bryobacteraceae bacterium]